ncbi:DUF4251 domain-containing protein [bacterium]|nr:DUF4251 domain-containing protein [bacterium]
MNKLNSRRIIKFIFGCLLLVGCGATKTVTNDTLDRMIQQKKFKILVKEVQPQITRALAQLGNSGIVRPGSTIGLINVAGDGFFITLDGEMVAANLPYYGERQVGGGYNNENGISFAGNAENLQITRDEKKNSYQVNFSIQNKTELFLVSIYLGASQYSTTQVNSSQRNRIRYNGQVSELNVSDDHINQ